MTNVWKEVSTILAGLFSALSVVLVAFYKFRGEKLEYLKSIKEKEQTIVSQRKELENEKIKLDFFSRIYGVNHFNRINDAVNYIFNKTSADRFLILIAVNGKTDFNVVTVIYELRKNKGNDGMKPIYKNVQIDNEYRLMLKTAEKNELVKLETKKMRDSKLKTFYKIEGVSFSHVRFLIRRPIDDNNDFIVFSSLATHRTTDFTDSEVMMSQLQYDGVIIPSIKNILE
jgi:hypothetical protein